MAVNIVHQVNQQFKVILPEAEQWLADQIEELISDSIGKFGYRVRQGKPQITDKIKAQYGIKRLVFNKSAWACLTDETKQSDARIFDSFCDRVGTLVYGNELIQHQADNYIRLRRFNNPEM